MTRYEYVTSSEWVLVKMLIHFTDPDCNLCFKLGYIVPRLTECNSWLIAAVLL